MTDAKTIHERKFKILQAIIDSYIEVPQPVSSHFLCEQYKLGVSSATVRNIMGDLEREGYLTQPHTSAGRIPTLRGYRLYVDNLMERKQAVTALLGDEVEDEYLQRLLSQTIDDMEYLIQLSAEALSSITHYTVVHCIQYRASRDIFFYTGTRYIIEEPEFHDWEQLRGLLNMLEEKQQLLELLLSSKVGLQFYIGREIPWEHMSGCAMAVNSYNIGPHVGQIAILGPARMNYLKVMRVLKLVSQQLSEKMKHAVERGSYER